MEWSTVALDASVLINLEATGRAADIANALGVRFVVPPQVAREALLIDVPTDEGIERRPRDLTAWGPFLEVVELDDRELLELVRLAHVLGDGESTTIAIAIASVRRMPIAIDDKKGLREAGQLGLEAVRTPDLLLRWERAGTPVTEVAVAIGRIEQRARFRPPPSDANIAWWAERSAAT